MLMDSMARCIVVFLSGMLIGLLVGLALSVAAIWII